MGHQGKRNRAEGGTKDPSGADADSGTRRAEAEADRAKDKVKETRADIEGRSRTRDGRTTGRAKKKQ